MSIKTMNRMKRIMHRERILLRKKETKLIGMLTASTITLFLIIGIILRENSHGNMAYVQEEFDAFGTVLLQDAGGYVLVSVLAFTAGAFFTIVWQKIRRRQKEKAHDG